MAVAMYHHPEATLRHHLQETTWMLMWRAAGHQNQDAAPLRKSKDRFHYALAGQGLISNVLWATTQEADKDCNYFCRANRPYILCLDSLGGTHPTVFKVLRSYLQQELLARKGLDMALTTKEIAGKYSSKVSTMISSCTSGSSSWKIGLFDLRASALIPVICSMYLF